MQRKTVFAKRFESKADWCSIYLYLYLSIYIHILYLSIYIYIFYINTPSGYLPWQVHWVKGRRCPEQCWHRLTQIQLINIENVEMEWCWAALNLNVFFSLEKPQNAERYLRLQVRVKEGNAGNWLADSQQHLPPGHPTKGQSRWGGFLGGFGNARHSFETLMSRKWGEGCCKSERP